MEKLYFDNKDVLTDYGVFLMNESGLLDPLKLKKTIEQDWPDEHGDDIYLGAPVFESRKFTLEIGIKATSKTTFKQNLHNFYNWLQSAGLRQLRLTNLDKVFMCYLDQAKGMNRLTSWNDNLMVGTAKFNFVEPEPVNRQFLTDQDPISTAPVVTLTSTPNDQVYTVHWGDGVSEEFDENDTAPTHTYTVAGDYYIVITGRMDLIDTLSVSNSTEITW